MELIFDMDLNLKPNLELNLNLKSNMKLCGYQKLKVFMSTMPSNKEHILQLQLTDCSFHIAING